jgi:hypothetical protein
LDKGFKFPVNEQSNQNEGSDQQVPTIQIYRSFVAMRNKKAQQAELCTSATRPSAPLSNQLFPFGQPTYSFLEKQQHGGNHMYTTTSMQSFFV